MLLVLLAASGFATAPGPARPVASGVASAMPSAEEPLEVSAAMPAAGRELYGYLPYWQMNATMATYLRGVTLTSLELFSVTATASGAIDRGQIGYKRITGAIGARLVADAHARGQRVEVAFSSFGFDRNARLFGIAALPSVQPRLRRPLDAVDPIDAQPAFATTAAALVSLVARLGLDGVNVDVEQIAPSSDPGFSEFITELRHGLDAVGPGLRLSAATMANRAGANLAGVALDAGADRVFMMGYDFHWSGSDPGASSPIDRLDGGASLRSAMATYASAGVPPDRVLLGLPLYGVAWPVAAPDRDAPRTGPGTAWLPSRHVAELTAPGFVPHPEPLEVAEYLSEVVPPAAGDLAGSVTWRAIFYDSPRTLRAKLALALAAGYAGGGFWALGYERGLPGYEDLMADFVAGRVAPTAPQDPGATRPPPPCVGRC